MMKAVLAYLIFSILLGAMYSSASYARVRPPSEIAAPRFTTKTGKELLIWVNPKFIGGTPKKMEDRKLIYNEIKVRSQKDASKEIILDRIHIIQGLELDVQLSYIKRITENKSGDLIILVGFVFRRPNAAFKYSNGTASYLVTKAQLDTFP